nr:nuclear pore complex protein NUP96 isoform X1 [Ipomoea batatas]
MDWVSTDLADGTVRLVGDIAGRLRESGDWERDCVRKRNDYRLCALGVYGVPVTWRVVEFTVGMVGYGCIRFIGRTDIRVLDLEHIVKFGGMKWVVYEDESFQALQLVWNLTSLLK